MTVAKTRGRNEVDRIPRNHACYGCHKVAAQSTSRRPWERSVAGATIPCMTTIEQPNETALVNLTESAATKIKLLMGQEPEGEAEVLRLAIQGGGCSGFQYGLGFDRGSQEGDIELLQHGVTIVVDPFSAPYLRGAQVDFVDGIQESGFKIDNPNASSSCGCGHSFQVEDEAAGETPAAAGGCGSGCSH